MPHHPTSVDSTASMVPCGTPRLRRRHRTYEVDALVGRDPATAIVGSAAKNSRSAHPAPGASEIGLRGTNPMPRPVTHCGIPPTRPHMRNLLYRCQ
jgi:hypothetical protein